MNNTPKESDKASSVKTVTSLAEFIAWVNKIGEENMLFRGMANAEWKIESSLHRRLILNGLEDINSAIFLEMTKIFINDARKQGYGIENSRILNDLELLTITRHYGAANCLIDFTQAPLVALCFACGVVDNNDKESTGKVIAFDKSNVDLYDEISIENSSEKIEHWLTEQEQNKKNWIFAPQTPKYQELISRATAQQSVFVFGSPTLPNENFHICEITNKKRVINELKKIGISAGLLFNDFVGFCEQNSYNNKFKNLFTYNNFVSGRIHQTSEEFESAIRCYDKAIKDNPTDLASYNNRGIAKCRLGNFQDAINDYNEAIMLNPKDWAAYHHRGVANHNLSNFQDAINDYNEAIMLNPKSYETYNHRGIAKIILKKFQDAISDCNEAIKLNSKDWVAYNNRGIANNNLGNFQNAISDCDAAIMFHPKSYEAYYNRGIAKIKLGSIKSALDDFSKAEKLNSEF